MRLDPLKMAETSQGRWDPHPPPAWMDAVCQDSRRLQGGELYVALHGPHFDGHDFVAAAKRGRAAAAMVSEEFRDDAVAGWPLLRVADTRQGLLNLAAGMRAAWPVRIVGITGSVGKTTVKEMVAQLLSGPEGKVPVARTYANWNNDVGVPLSLLNSPPDARYGVFEIGTNHPGELMPLARLLQPQVGVVTNVAAAHLEHFGSLQAIAHEKAALLRALPAGGTAVLNRDHAGFNELRRAAPCRVVTVSMAAETRSDYRGLNIETLDDGMLRLHFLDVTGERRRLIAPVRGRHQAANLLLAAATVRQLGCEWEWITETARSLRMPPMRWQRVQQSGITLINDAYNANPLSMRAALETFAGETAAGRRWLVLGGMLELGDATVAAHREIGARIAKGSWQGLITVGDLAHEIAAGAREAGFSAEAVRECRDVHEAGALLRESVKPGDAVLLKGSRAYTLENLVHEITR